MPFEAGVRIGHYEVVGLIGEGGMGQVYRATDQKLHRDVALKVLPGDTAADPARLDRFKREARAVAALNHPNIITIHSVEEADGLHFLTMELVEGRTLAAVLAGGATSPDQFLAIAVPLTDAVATAHAMGITHRDLKPQNIMFGKDGRLKVLDFGLARHGDQAATSPATDVSTMLRTQEGLVVGTVPYMSPEQLEGRAVDQRSDVFSIGVILYEMATGRRPFMGPTPLAEIIAITRDEPEPISTLAPAFPIVLHELIDRCLAKTPGARFADAGAVHEALRQLRLQERPARGAEAPAEPGRTRPSRPPLIGRSVEQKKLDEFLGLAAAGQGGLALLGGEPGVGKTRLAEELLAAARAKGMLAVTGHCYEAGSTPFAPFVEVIEQMLREVPPQRVRKALGDDAPDLARLVPKIRRVYFDVPAPAPLEPEPQRRTLLNAVVDVFSRLSAHHPIVMLLDDLHWADDATAGLLQHVSARLSGLPILIVGTYRDAEFDLGKPFGRTIAGLMRQYPGCRLQVRCLSETGVAELLAAFGGSAPPRTLVEAIFHQTEGNPFFVGEVFQHFSEEGRLFDYGGQWNPEIAVDAHDLPEGVRLVIGRRLARLSDATQTMLTAAAVVGRQFDLALVEQLCALDVDAFLQAVEEAEAAKLVAPERAGRQANYVFSHELIRSTLLSALSLPRRQRFQAKVAKTIEAMYAGSVKSHAPTIAHHLYEAGPAADAKQTIRFLALASDQAIEAGALENGLRDIERALSLVSEDDPGVRATLLWKYGLVHRSVGQLPDAIRDWETALTLAEAAGDSATIVGVCQELAHGYAWMGQPMEGVAAARRGLAVLGPEPSPDRCRLLACVGWNQSMATDFASADPIMRDALEMATALGDDHLRGEALLLSNWHYYLCMRRREQADACRQAIALLRPSGDVARLGEALGNLQMASLQIGRPRDIALTEQETRKLAERLGRFDVKVHRYYTEALRDWMLLGDLGRLDAALPQVVDVSGAWGWLAVACQSQTLLWRGEVEAATARARDSVAGEPPISTHTGPGWSMLFVCECTAGHRESALALLDQHAAGLPQAGKLNTLGSWSALLKVVEGLAMLGASARAAALYPLVLEALRTGTLVAFDSSHLLDTIAGMSAAAGGQWDAAERHYQRAIAQADEMPFVSEQAETRYWHARMRIDRDAPDDRARARILLNDALTRYRAIGMPWFEARAQTLLETC